MKNKVSLKRTGEGKDAGSLLEQGRAGSIPEQDRSGSIPEQDRGGSIMEQDREISQQSFEDSWMDDEDDDDDDDDDKDYGQVEEPTLVNASLEGDQLNNSLNLSILPHLAVKDEVPALDPTLSQGATKEELPAISLESVPAIRQAPPQAAEASQDVLSAPTLMSTSPQALISQGKVVGVALPNRPTPEKRERDESWKKYLIR